MFKILFKQKSKQNVKTKKRKWVIIGIILFMGCIAIEANAKIKVGEKALLFTLKDLKGETITSEEFFPKYRFTVLVFWDSCCAPCLRVVARSQTIFEKVQKEFKDVTVLGINFDKKNLAAMRAFVKKQGITYPTLLDTQNKVSEIYGAGLNTVSFFIIDHQGIIRYIYIGHPPNIIDIIMNELEKLYKER